MKKLFSILLVCTFAFSTVTFVGCGGKKEATPAPAAGGGAAADDAAADDAAADDAAADDAAADDAAATE